MKAAYYEQFHAPITIEALPDPHVPADGVVIRVMANGVCRSDWHGWMGHDADIQLPHVPGHEWAGIVEEVGKEVRNWRRGDRVTAPFVCGCGVCRECASGNQHICDNQFQPGFTAWGSMAEYVAIRYADNNLVRLPDTLGFVDAAALGCRFVTSFHAVVQKGRASAGEFVVVHGCGGVGLSAVMIAAALGAQVIAVDINDAKLAFAREIGALHTINARKQSDVVGMIRALTDGGAQLSLDALGSRETCLNSINSLRKRGRHVQVGLMVADDATPAVPMALLHAWEIELLGAHGMQAWQYPSMLAMIAAGTLQPAKLIDRRIGLHESAEILQNLNTFPSTGILVIDQF
jgi:alcohol dehydrogenase